ncbi:unnamed protein product [Arctia plantaginis]|uniref:Globin domain-containing protein n=1 Tax=Arctia plantaginis TaxID=874455 RepID=A0A8S1AFV7_ARCPL|nr:unnamed protein product [Arctia plantaginis]
MDKLADIATKLWWGGDPDEKNPTSGMSRRDVYNVRKSWTKINADAQGNGFLMFSRLFEADPESKTFFSYLSDTNKEQMARSFTFQAHIVFIMASLNSAVENLPQPEIVVSLMTKLGRAHHRQNIRRKHFRVFEEVLMNILKNDLRLSEDVVASWTLFVAFMYKHMFTAITE